MVQLLHRVKIFVFQVEQLRPTYLLLRREQGIESSWGPVQGPVGYDEKLETAIRREVQLDTGILTPPEDLIDLAMPARWLLGDEEVIEWSYGVRLPSPIPALRLEQDFSGYRWAEFPAAYPQLELEQDRAAILRLHTLLREL